MGNIGRMEVFLVRHGQVSADFDGQYYGGTEVPLSAHGRVQAGLAGDFLAQVPLEQIYCSPLGRARYGADQVATRQKGCSIRSLDGFREIDRGRWLGSTKSEVLGAWPDDMRAHQNDLENWRGHGGESLGDLRDRVLAQWTAMLADRPMPSVLAVVSHLFPTRAILAQALGMPLDAWSDLEIGTGSVSWLSGEGSNWKVKLLGHQPDGREFSKLYPQSFPQSAK
jgi:broad specificity phosphatase PhoE